MPEASDVVLKTLFLVGLFGLFLSSFLPGLIGWLCSPFRGFIRNRERLSPPRSVAILIPAHNEEKLLLKTIDRVKASIAFSKADVKVELMVGLDACSDGSQRIMESAAISYRTCAYRSKWRTLVAMVEDTSCEWVGFVDVGALWSRALFKKSVSLMAYPSVMGVAPSYTTEQGLFARFFWRIEKAIKNLENASGGPVSVHGASVFYRRKELLAALGQLKDRAWINDDVVIPLTMRSMYPSKSILYMGRQRDECYVEDLGIIEPSRRITSRKRMALGNVEWIRGLFLATFLRSPLVGVVALRRVFRPMLLIFLAMQAVSLLVWLSLYFRVEASAIVLLLVAFFAALWAPQLRGIWMGSLSFMWGLLLGRDKKVAWK